MHKIIFLYLLFIFQSLSYSSTFYFENIPIQDAGRVKPIDTYAEKTLLSIYERRALKDPSVSASDWLIESIVNPDEAYSKNVFKIKSKDIANALDLEWRDPHYYSYSEISNGINSNIDYFIKLYLLPEDQKSVVEKQLSNLFSNIGLFKSIQIALHVWIRVLQFIIQKLSSSLELILEMKLVMYFIFSIKRLLIQSLLQFRVDQSYIKKHYRIHY